jgi:hypothetical protein
MDVSTDFIEYALLGYCYRYLVNRYNRSLYFDNIYIAKERLQTIRPDEKRNPLNLVIKGSRMVGWFQKKEIVYKVARVYFTDSGIQISAYGFPYNFQEIQKILAEKNINVKLDFIMNEPLEETT